MGYNLKAGTKSGAATLDERYMYQYGANKEINFRKLIRILAWPSK